MKRILIAEDNPVNRELLRELLEMEGYEVFEACHGQEALDIIGEVRPDLLILDLDMPVLDGLGTVRKLRADALWAGLPMLAATAYAMRGDREMTLEAGFDGYISKPIHPGQLKEEIGRLLDMRNGEGVHSSKPAKAAGG
jgi:CheY-like chemotaxis protein